MDGMYLDTGRNNHTTLHDIMSQKPLVRFIDGFSFQPRPLFFSQPDKRCRIIDPGLAVCSDDGDYLVNHGSDTADIFSSVAGTL